MSHGAGRWARRQVGGWHGFFEEGKPGGGKLQEDGQARGKP